MSVQATEIPLSKAEAMAKAALEFFNPFVDRIEIAGSIRRRRPICHDVDLVCLVGVAKLFAFNGAISRFAAGGQVRLNGTSIQRVTKDGISYDFYITDDPARFATLLLIRTGSARHNVFLCSRAKDRGMKLHANGDGLFKLAPLAGQDERVGGDTEESIFAALGLSYLPPEKREV